MALRLGKRKRPPREEKPFSEQVKIAHRVFDDATVNVLVHFINKGVFERVDYPIASGKESIVFRVSSDKGFLAAKVFKYETSAFRNFTEYIQGDPRFKMKRTRRELVKLWAQKEFANLKKAKRAGVSVPEAIAQKENVVVMEFLGEKGIPYSSLEEVALDDKAAVYEDVLDNAKKIYQTGLVHADLSAFNILYDEKASIIDWAQAVVLEHPRASEFLERDAKNLAKFFQRNGLDVSWENILSEITGKKH